MSSAHRIGYIIGRLYRIVSLRSFICALVTIGLTACAQQVLDSNSDNKGDAAEARFTLAVIPDTQNYMDYTHQSSAGFALDAADLFIEQMRYIAANGVSQGGDIVFVAAVGDVWQHQSKVVDDAHVARGVGANQKLPRQLKAYLGPKAETRSFEVPKAIEGYRIISEAGLPFGVAPGNHDYDAMWSVADFKADLSGISEELRGVVKMLGTLHVGGLDNFRSAFGADTNFFAGKPWYVANYNGGTSSAQTFSAGGYQFLHLALEMQPGDEVIAWAESVLAKYPGVPTIISTHDYLNTDGERVANPLVDLAAADPDGNNGPQQMWDKLFSQHDQIFLVLCGHQHGQNHRIDDNINGLPVYQVLADYQDRGQVGVDAGAPLDPLRQKPVGIGDGWLRLMRFDLNGDAPKVTVQTYSTYYKNFSFEEPEYADWYKHIEQPRMSDEDFYQADDFVLSLEGFHQRFHAAKAVNR